MQAKNQLLFTLISKNKGYHLKTKKEKGYLLDEYCRITGQNRKAVIQKIKSGSYIKSMRKEAGWEKRKRKKKYGKDVVAVLIRIWEIFDRPCGGRLRPLLQIETDRLLRLGEIDASVEIMEKLKAVSVRSIDSLLAPHKEKERLNKKYKKKNHPLLYQKIPIKLSHEQGRGIGETIQIDLVEHCGSSPKGRFINTVSTTDIGSGWWEGEAVFGKEARAVHGALYNLAKRYPFAWREIHPDNGSEFINETLYGFTKKHKLGFSRSRPFGKNDNCFVEQKNSTHVRQMVGHQRYDKKKELDTLNELYNILSLYKNLFQPIIPLLSKERIGGRLKRKYGSPKTPYQNVIESKTISLEKKQQLTKVYQQINPAKLKRQIEEKQNRLWKLMQTKEQEQIQTIKMKNELNNSQNLIHISVTKLIAEPTGVRS
jgi:hypothetical protein